MSMIFKRWGMLLFCAALLGGCGKDGQDTGRGNMEDGSSEEVTRATAPVQEDPTPEETQPTQNAEKTDGKGNYGAKPSAADSETARIESQYKKILLQYKQIQEDGLSQEEIDKIGLRTELIQYGWPTAGNPDEVEYLFYDVDGDGMRELLITYYDEIVDIYAYDGEKVRYAYGAPYNGLIRLFPGGMLEEITSQSAEDYSTTWYRFDTVLGDFLPDFELLVQSGSDPEYYVYCGVDDSDRDEVVESYRQTGYYPVWVWEWADMITEEEYNKMCPQTPVSLPSGTRFAELDLADVSVAADPGTTDVAETDYEKAACRDIADIDISDNFYGVWVGAYKDYDQAYDLVMELFDNGFGDAAIATSTDFSNLNKELYYCVAADMTYDKDEADQMIDDLKAAGYSSAYVKNVGDYVTRRYQYVAYGSEYEDAGDMVIIHCVRVYPAHGCSVNFYEDNTMDLIVDKNTVFDKNGDLMGFGTIEDHEDVLGWMKEKMNCDFESDEVFALVGVFEVTITGTHIDSYYGSYWWD